MKERNINVECATTRQHRRVVFPHTISQYMKERNTNAANVIQSLPRKSTYLHIFNQSTWEGDMHAISVNIKQLERTISRDTSRQLMKKINTSAANVIHSLPIKTV